VNDELKSRHLQFIVRHSSFSVSFMDVRSILLPTDFSECARHAVPVAAEFARLLGARVVCLHVVEPVVQPAAGWTPLAEPLPSADEVGGRLGVEDLIARGEPAAELVRAAEERGAGLIVISSPGRTGLGRILFGSTAESVVRHARCPVLVVKPPKGSDED
jgi:universal stress protein A